MEAAAGIKEIMNIIPRIMEMPYQHIWTDYDKEADTLYINFKRPSHADETEMTEDDIIIRYEKKEIIGMTVLNASKRK